MYRNSIHFALLTGWPKGATYITSNFLYCVTLLFIAKIKTRHSYRACICYTVVKIAAYTADLTRMWGTISTLASTREVCIVAIGFLGFLIDNLLI